MHYILVSKASQFPPVGSSSMQLPKHSIPILESVLQVSSGHEIFIKWYNLSILEEIIISPFIENSKGHVGVYPYFQTHHAAPIINLRQGSWVFPFWIPGQQMVSNQVLSNTRP